MLAFLSTPTQCLKSQGKLSFRCYTLCFEDRNYSTRFCGGLYGSAAFRNLQRFLKSRDKGTSVHSLVCVSSASPLQSSLMLMHTQEDLPACSEANAPVNAPVYLYVMPVQLQSSS